MIDSLHALSSVLFCGAPTEEVSLRGIGIVLSGASDGLSVSGGGVGAGGGGGGAGVGAGDTSGSVVLLLS